MDKTIMAWLLNLIFTKQELHRLQLKMYNAVSCQPKGYYSIDNMILDKLGGEPMFNTELDEQE